MSKQIKPIEWILRPIWLPCTICGIKQSVNEVILDDAAHFAICENCSKLTEKELKAKLFNRKGGEKSHANHIRRDSCGCCDTVDLIPDGWLCVLTPLDRG